MSYQSFPWIKGSSKSYDKLLALQIPNPEGKSFLDVGCNEGYFCGYADFLGASKVVGIDKNPRFLALAKALFPACEFVCQSWDNLPDEKFDIVLNASAIHYADDQKEFLDRLMERVKPGGALILEIGVAPGENNEFVEVKRSIDTRLFPTKRKLEEMLGDYAWKFISRSVPQGGDPIPREVYHVTRKLPYAILALDNSHTGKTFTIEQIFKSNIKRISGDSLYGLVAKDQLKAPEKISEIIRRAQRPLNYSLITWEICRSGLLDEYCRWLLLQIEPGKSFILDTYAPASVRETIARFMENAGYYVVNMRLQKAVSAASETEKAPPDSAWRYYKHLQKEFMINEADYLAANPDVAKALAEGKVTGAFEHYILHGRKEGRKREPGKK